LAAFLNLKPKKMKPLKFCIVGIALFAVSSLFITNCKSPDVLLREGRYDLAIDKCVKKLKKKPTKEKYTLVLEDAFKKVNQRDDDRTQYLKKEFYHQWKIRRYSSGYCQNW